MNRLEFSKSIINVDPVTQVRLFFNETMAMYNLSEGLNYNCIKGFIDNEDSIKFVITFNLSSEEINKIANDIIGRSVSIYNKVFLINGDVTGTEMTLRFIEQK